MRLYHFTNEKYGILNLEMRRLKIARIADLNDPFEFLPACPDAKARKVINDFKRRAHANVGLLCFSETRSNPVQWSHYADSHKGICFGFDLPDDHVKKVRYAPSRPTADMQRLFANMESGHEEINRWLEVKYDHWQYEQEWRAALILTPQNRHPDGNYYQDFSPDLRLAEVWVGHRSKLTRLDLTNLLGDLAEYVGVAKARLAFRENYEVVEQKNRRLW
jgi:hypothetical protein